MDCEQPIQPVHRSCDLPFPLNRIFSSPTPAHPIFGGAPLRSTQPCWCTARLMYRLCLSVCPSHAGIVSKLGMYRIAIFKIRQEPDSTGYQTNYPAGTRYLDTCCIIANFFDYFVVQIKKMYYRVCLHFKTTTRNHTTLSLFYSNVFTIWQWVN